MLAYSFSDDYYKKGAEGVKETIKEAIDDLNDDDVLEDENGFYVIVNVGEAMEYDDSICVETFIGNQQEKAYDEMGEYAEYYLDEIEDEIKTKLENQLNEFWKKFKKENKITANFFTVEKIESFRVELEHMNKYFYEMKSYRKL